MVSVSGASTVISWIVSFSIALIACDDSPAASSAPSATALAPATSSTASAARTSERVPDEAVLPAATLNGTKLALQHAIAFGTGGDTIFVWLSNEPLACKDVPNGYFDVRKDETRVQLTFARGYAATQAKKWVVRRVMVQQKARVRSDRRPEKGAKVALELADASTALTGKLDLKAPTQGMGELSLDGRLVALGCGERPSNAQAPSRPQGRLDAKVAQTKVVFRGARLAGSASTPTKLELSTAPLDQLCGSPPPAAADMFVAIRLTGEPAKPAEVTVHGARLASPMLAPSDSMKLALRPERHGVVPIDLTFEYRGLTISGVAEAQICKPSP